MPRHSSAPPRPTQHPRLRPDMATCTDGELMVFAVTHTDRVLRDAAVIEIDLRRKAVR